MKAHTGLSEGELASKAAVIQLKISSLFVSSENRVRVDGIPARNEWQEMVFSLGR
jgi:hypothetical protein